MAQELLYQEAGALITAPLRLSGMPRMEMVVGHCLMLLTSTLREAAAAGRQAQTLVEGMEALAAGVEAVLRLALAPAG